MSTIGFEQLLAYAAGELDPRSAGELERQLAASPVDADVFRRLKSAIETMRRDDTVAPPAEVIARARAIFERSSVTARRGWFAGVREVIAALVYDSRLTPGVVGFRSTGAPTMLTYSAEGAEIDIQIEPAQSDRGESRIMGQVTAGALPAGARAELLCEDGQAVQCSAAIDSHGVFMLAAPAGRYVLGIRCGETAFILDDLEID